MSAAPQKAKAHAVSYWRCGTPRDGVASTSWCQAAMTQPATATTTTPTAAKRIADQAATRGMRPNFIPGRPDRGSEAGFYLDALDARPQARCHDPKIHTAPPAPDRCRSAGQGPSRGWMFQRTDGILAHDRQSGMHARPIIFPGLLSGSDPGSSSGVGGGSGSGRG